MFEVRPWTKDPEYFNHIKISAVALIKMVIHARSGGDIEVMGMMQGKVVGRTFVVMDAFALPVEGTETRVNVGNDANEYMVNHIEASERVGRLESICGWYHSHPGYGCWLSGIDVGTEQLQQRVSDPFCAIVIDPHRTISAGKVELGVFRTYPEDHVAKEKTDFEHVPLGKIDDFGIHAHKYYKIPHSFFKSKLDNDLLDFLWNQYWVQTLSQSPIIMNREHITNNIVDFTEKLEKAESAPTKRGRHGLGGQKKKKEDNELKKVCAESSKTAMELNYGIMVEMLKGDLFTK